MTKPLPSGAQIWILGARLRTLPAAIMPVMVGSSCAGAFAGQGTKRWTFALLALVVSLALQVGVNYANDYSDGVRGTDAKRVGPVRLVGSGLVQPSVVKRAAFISFGIAALAGLVIALGTSLWLVVVGAACIGAGWLYTGGPRPYGYMGLGELFVFVFFGLVATCGTMYAVVQQVSLLCLFASAAVGCLAVALLVVNNLRDIPGDTEVGKVTLAVRLGDSMTRALYYALFVLCFVAIVLCAMSRRGSLIGIIGLIVAVPAIRAVRSGAQGRDLIAVLTTTGKTQMAIGVLLSLGILL
ncbi:MAG: 1,4-dihydroxy-2-naphthoate polyprenyltransferase [Actinobacteria bacterium]|nr:MAG: 1,4-dihydroxy-2-naphthoate polyprenyltransferase [Actinomycetota bacterium]